MDDIGPYLPHLITLASSLIARHFTDQDDTALSQTAVDAVGDLGRKFAVSKIEQLLGDRRNAARVHLAFQEAEDCFRYKCEDDRIRQAVSSLPLSGLNSLQGFAEGLPESLDDEGLFLIIRKTISRDWKGQLSDEEIDYAARLYRDCLDEKLAALAGQLIETLFRISKRTAGLAQQTLDGQSAIEASQLRQELLLDKLLPIVSTVGEHLVLSAPVLDAPPMRPAAYIERASILGQFREALQESSWLALIDGAGKGKTQIAVDLLSDRSLGTGWISLRGKVGQEASRHIVEQLRLLLTIYSSVSEVADSNAEGLQDITSAASSQARFRMPQGFVLVIDDLPDPLTSSSTYEILEQIAVAIMDAEGRLITTGQRDLPQPIANSMVNIIHIASLPPLSTTEISSLIEIAGGPTDSQSKVSLSSIVSATTLGHPQLISATLHWLSTRRWSVGLEELEALISGEPVQSIREQAGRQALNFLHDEQREFLFRLSIISSSFDQTTAISVAEIEPAILHPTSRLTELCGPYVDRLDEERFQVSAVFGRTGEQNISSATLIAVHSAVANIFLNSGTISVNDAINLVAHLIGAKRHSDLVFVLLQLLVSARTKSMAEQISWAARIIPPGSQLEAELPLGKLLLLRAAQLSCLAFAERDLDQADIEFEKVLLKRDEIDDVAIGFALVTAGPMSTGVPPIPSIRRGVEGIRALRRGGFPELDVFPHTLEEVLWFPAIHISKAEELDTFLNEISEMTSDERSAFFSSDMAPEALAQIIDSSTWGAEHGKPKEEQDWDNVIARLQSIETAIKDENMELLGVPLARAIAITYADYLHQPQLAIKKLEITPQPLMDELRFLLQYTKSCVLIESGESAEALAPLTEAVDIDCDAFTYYRLDARRRLVIVTTQAGDFDEAKEVCKEFFRWFKRNIPAEEFTIDYLEMMGELAWIHWESHNRTLACASLYGMIGGLLRSPEKEGRYREAFNKAMHSLGWFSTVAQFGSPPSEVLSGDEYMPVQAGLFGYRKEQLANYTPAIGFSEAHLLSLLGELTFKAGHPRLSWHIFESMKEVSQSGDRAAIINVGLMHRASLAAMLSSPDEAVGIGIRAVRFLSAVADHSESGSDLLGPDPKMEETWNSLSHEERAKFESLLSYFVVGPTFAWMISQQLNLSEQKKVVGNLQLALGAAASELTEHRKLQELVRTLDEMLNEMKSVQKSESMIRKLYKDQPIPLLIWFLAESARPGIGATEVLRYHAIIVDSMLRSISIYEGFVPSVVQVIIRIWARTARTMRFALNSPDIFQIRIREVSKDLSMATAVEIINQASAAVGVRLPAETRRNLATAKE